MAPKMQRTISYVKRQFQFRKPICPFISSTFQDFQVERDILTKRVFPSLNALCQSRGTYCAPVDLRWGISDSQVMSGRVVQLCLNYIDRCAPFFICLLGERYGTQRPADSPPLPTSYTDLPPDCHWMDRSLMQAAQVGYDWLLDVAHQYCSVTELEVVHAALMQRNQFARFYFRRPEHVDGLLRGVPEAERAERLQVYESESAASRLRVRQLKSRIAASGLNIQYFNTPEELASFVMQDWRQIVDALYPPLQDFVDDAYSERFTEWMAHETFAETRRQTFVQTPELESIFDELTQFALTSLDEQENDVDVSTITDGITFSTDAECSIKTKNALPAATTPSRLSTILLTGERGSGKTSVLANWLQQFSREHGDHIKVFAHYVGSSALSTDLSCFMRRCIVELREDSQQQMAYTEAETEGDEMASFHRLCEEFIAALSLSPCVILIDGIDELRGSSGVTAEKVKEMLWLLPCVPPQCRIVVSLASSTAAYRSLSCHPDTRVIIVPPLADSRAKLNVMQSHLGLHCKCLGGAQLRRVAASRLSTRPLFLAVLASELRMCGAAHSSLDSHLDTYLRVASVAHLWVTIIQRWLADYSWTTHRSRADTTNLNCPGSGGWVADALRLIAVSRHGLSRTEILEILAQLGYTGSAEVTSFEWALFRCAAVDSLFERPAGLLNFFHDQFKDAVEYSLLGCSTAVSGQQHSMSTGKSQPSCRQTFHRHLANYFTGQKHSRRRAEELPWHLQQSAEPDTLCKVLAETRVFGYMYAQEKCCMNSRRLDLIKYWKVLTQAGYNAGDTYQNMMESLYQRHSKQSQQSDIDSGHTCIDTDDLQDGLEEMKCNRCSQMALASLANKAGQLLSLLQHFDEAEQMLLKAHRTLHESFPLEHGGLKLLCSLEESIAQLYRYQLKKEQAKGWYLRALRSTESLLDNLVDSIDIACLTELKGRVLDHLGHMNTFERQIDKAETNLVRAYKCMESCECMTGMARVLYHIGFLRIQQKQYELAEQCYRHSLSIIERWCGKSHPLVGDVLNDLAGLYCNPAAGTSYDIEKAETLYRRALHIREHVFGPEHILVATTLFHLGKMLMAQRRVPSTRCDALCLLRRALDIRTTKLGCDHSLTKAIQRVLKNFELTPEHRSFYHDHDVTPLLMRPRVKTARLKTVSDTTECYNGQPRSVKMVDAIEDTAGNELNLINGSRGKPEENGCDVKHGANIPHDTTIAVNNHVPQVEKSPANCCEKPLISPMSVVIKVEDFEKNGSDCRNGSIDALLTENSTRFQLVAPDDFYIDNFSEIASRAKSAPVKKTEVRKRVHQRPMTSMRRMKSAEHDKLPVQRQTQSEDTTSILAGSNTSLLSLLSPRPVSRQLVHAAAWYQVPGRYSTVQQPYAPKRMQRRIDLQLEDVFRHNTWPPAMCKQAQCSAMPTDC